jgi:hypothetical protein
MAGFELPEYLGKVKDGNKKAGSPGLIEAAPDQTGAKPMPSEEK